MTQEQNMQQTKDAILAYRNNSINFKQFFTSMKEISDWLKKQEK